MVQFASYLRRVLCKTRLILFFSIRLAGLDRFTWLVRLMPCGFFIKFSLCSYELAQVLAKQVSSLKCRSMNIDAIFASLVLRMMRSPKEVKIQERPRTIPTLQYMHQISVFATLRNTCIYYAFKALKRQ